jgi:hypothetical protein
MSLLHWVLRFLSPQNSLSIPLSFSGLDHLDVAKADWPEVLAEIAKAGKFSPKLAKWILATTSPFDAVLQKAAREFSTERSGTRRQGSGSRWAGFFLGFGLGGACVYGVTRILCYMKTTPLALTRGHILRLRFEFPFSCFAHLPVTVTYVIQDVRALHW